MPPSCMILIAPSGVPVILALRMDWPLVVVNVSGRVITCAEMQRGRRRAAKQAFMFGIFTLVFCVVFPGLSCCLSYVE